MSGARRNDKKATGKLARIVGIGGIHCNCCTVGPPAVTKRLWNRLDRRRWNRQMIEEVLDEMGYDPINEVYPIQAGDFDCDPFEEEDYWAHDFSFLDKPEKM